MAGLRHVATIWAVLALQWTVLVHGMVHSFDLIPIAPPGTSEGHPHVDEYAMMVSIGSTSQVVPVLPALYINTSRTLNVPTAHGCERDKSEKQAEDECNARMEKAGRLFQPLKDQSYSHRGDGSVETSSHSFTQGNIEYGETIFSWKEDDSLNVFNRTPVSIALFNTSTLGMGVMDLNTFSSGTSKGHIDGQPSVDVLSVFTGHDDRTGCVILGGYDDNMIDHNNMGVWTMPPDAQGLNMNLQAITIGPKHKVPKTFGADDLKKALDKTTPSSSLDFNQAPGPVTFPADNTPVNLAYDAQDMRLPEKALAPILSLLGNPTFDTAKAAYVLPKNDSVLQDFAIVFHFANDTGPVNVRIPAKALVMQDPDINNPLTPYSETGMSYIALSPLPKGDTNAYLGRVFLKYVYVTNDHKNGRFHLAAINASAPTNAGRHLKDGSPVITGQMADMSKDSDMPADSPQKKKSNIAIIVGGVFAGLILLLLIILAILHCIRRRRKTREGSLRSNLISAPFPMAAVPQRPRTPTGQRSPTAQPAATYPTRRLSSLWLQRPGYPSGHDSSPEMQTTNRYGIGAGESSRQGEMAARAAHGSGFTNAAGEPSSHYRDDTTVSDTSGGHPLERTIGNATPSPRGKGFRPNPLIVGAAAAGAAATAAGALAVAKEPRQRTYSVSSAESMSLSPEDDRFPPSMLSTPPPQGRRSSLTAGFPFPPMGAGLAAPVASRRSPLITPHEEHVASYLVGDVNVSSVVESPRRMPNVIVRERELTAPQRSSLTAMSYVSAEGDPHDKVDNMIADTLYSAPTNNSDEDAEWKAGHPAWLDANRKQSMSPISSGDLLARKAVPGAMGHSAQGSQGSSQLGGRPVTPGGLGILESDTSTPAGGYHTPDSILTPRAHSPTETRKPVRRTSSRYSMDGLYPPPLTAAERNIMMRPTNSPRESMMHDFANISATHPNADLDPPHHFTNEASTQRERAYTLSQSSRYLPIFPPPSLNYQAEQRRVPRRSTSVDSNPYDSWLETVQPQAQEATLQHLPSTRYVPPSQAFTHTQLRRDRQETRPQVQERPLSDASSLYDFSNDHGEPSFPEPTTYDESYAGAHPLERAPPLPPRAARIRGLDDRGRDLHSPTPSNASVGDLSRTNSSRMSAVRDFQYPGRPIRRFVSIDEGPHGN